MVELNESLSVENKRTLEPFFDDAAEKITKMKKGIDILTMEYGKFLIWLGIPPSSHKVGDKCYVILQDLNSLIVALQKCPANQTAEVLLNLRTEVVTVADKIKEEEMQGVQGGKVADITEALKLQFSGRKFSSRRVRKSVRGYLNKN